jgi:hypothetical protein
LGDAVIAGAAVFGMFKTGGDADGARVSILSSAFTAVGTMTAAYFGIRAASNTAQASMPGQQPPTGIAGPEAERPEAGPPAAAGPAPAPPPAPGQAAEQPPVATPPEATPPEATPPEATPPEAIAPEAIAPEQPPEVEEVDAPEGVVAPGVPQHLDATQEDHKATPTQTGPVDDDPPQTESQHPDTLVASDLPDSDDWSEVPEGEIDEGDQEGKQA